MACCFGSHALLSVLPVSSPVSLSKCKEDYAPVPKQILTCNSRDIHKQSHEQQPKLRFHLPSIQSQQGFTTPTSNHRQERHLVPASPINPRIVTTTSDCNLTLSIAAISRRPRLDNMSEFFAHFVGAFALLCAELVFIVNLEPAAAAPQDAGIWGTCQHYMRARLLWEYLASLSINCFCSYIYETLGPGYAFEGPIRRRCAFWLAIVAFHAKIFDEAYELRAGNVRAATI
jgi:hypothetical protein